MTLQVKFSSLHLRIKPLISIFMSRETSFDVFSHLFAIIAAEKVLGRLD